MSQALWRAHVEQALRAARALKAGLPRRGLRCATRSRCVRWSLLLVVATFFAAGGERVQAHHRGVRLAGVVQAANFRVDAWVTPPPTPAGRR